MPTARPGQATNTGRAPSGIVQPGLRNHLRVVGIVLGAVWALTALAGLLGELAPGLASGGRPHPTLHGSAGEILAILTDNLRILIAPFLLAALHWPAGQRTGRLGDLMILALVLANTAPVGLALGRFGSQLLPYLPHLPLEWAALAASSAAWLAARRGNPPRVLAAYGIAVLILASPAAVCEVTLTPHPRTDRAAGSLKAPGAGIAHGPLHAGPGVVCLRLKSCAGAARSLQGRKLPSPRSARFRSATPAFRATSTTRSPQGGTT